MIKFIKTERQLEVIRGWRGRRNEELLFNKKKVSAARLPGWLSSKESACQHKRWEFYPWVRKILWRSGNPLQYSCLGNLMDRGPGGLQSMELQESETQLSN